MNGLVEKKIAELEKIVKDLKVVQAIPGSSVKTYFYEKTLERRKVFDTDVGYTIDVKAEFRSKEKGIVYLSGWLEEYLEGQEGTTSYVPLYTLEEVDGNLVSTTSLASGTTIYSKTVVSRVYATAYGTVQGDLSLNLDITPYESNV